MERAYFERVEFFANALNILFSPPKVSKIITLNTIKYSKINISGYSLTSLDEYEAYDKKIVALHTIG